MPSLLQRCAVLPLLVVLAGCGSSTTTKPGVAAYAIWGTVRDSAGASVEGADVFAIRRISASSVEATVSATDSSGRFAFADVPTGAYEVAIALPGRTRVAGAAVTVPPSHTTLEFTLERGSVVAGTIAGPAPEPGARAAGAEITLSCLGASGFTDAGGGYALAGIPAGSWRLGASRVFRNSAVETTITVPAGADTVHVPPIWLP